MRKFLLLVFAAVASVELLYAVAANAFLSFGGLGYLFKDTNSVNARFARAWTIWPGRVHVRDLRITFQDKNLEWSVDLGRVYLVVALAELPRRTFHATHLRAERVAFRMRHRISPSSAHEAWIGALPPIPEFPAPALFEATVPEAPISDAKYNLWTVHLDDVDVAVSELWIQAFRYVGAGRATGKFLLRPARWLWVGPAALDLAPGTLSASAYQVTSNLHGRIECSVEPFDVRVPTGLQVLRHISAHVRLSADALSPEVATLFAPAALRGITATGGAFVLDLRATRGVIAPESHLELSEQNLELETNGCKLAAEVVRLSAHGLAADQSVVTLGIEKAHLDRPFAQGAGPDIGGAELSMASENLDSTRDFRMSALSLNHADVTLADARWLDDLLRLSGVKLRGKVQMLASGRYAGRGGQVASARISFGSNARLLFRNGAELAAPLARAELAASSDLEAHTLRFALNAPELVGRAGKPRLQTSLVAHGTLSQSTTSRRTSLDVVGAFGALDFLSSSAHATARRMPLRAKLTSYPGRALEGVLLGDVDKLVVTAGGVRVAFDPHWEARFAPTKANHAASAVHLLLTTDAVLVRDAAEPAECPWFQTARSRLEADTEFDEAQTQAGRLTGHFSNARLRWGDVTTVASIDVESHIAGNPNDERSSAEGIVTLESARISQGQGSNKGWSIEVPKLDLRYQLEKVNDQGNAKLSVSAPGSQGRIGATRFSTDLTSSMLLDALDFQRRTAAGSAILRLTDSSVFTTLDPVDHWWATVKLDGLRAKLGETLGFHSAFSARARDASPAFSVLAADGTLPHWVSSIFPVRAPELKGSVARVCRLTDFRLEHLSAGPTMSVGTFQSFPDGFRGAVLIQLAAFTPFSAGLSFTAQQTDVSPLVGEAWLGRWNQYFSRKLGAANEASCPKAAEGCTN